MTNMSKDEKRMMLFDMQEHPEKYTDEQVEHLLDDEEVKEFFHELAMARMAGKKANPKEVDVDEAWKEFVQAHLEDKMAMDAGRAKDAYRNRVKIAASIVGIIQQQLRHPFLHALMSYQVETAVADAPHQVTFLTLRHQNHIIGKNLGEYFAHYILALVIIRKNASGQIVHLRVMLTE